MNGNAKSILSGIAAIVVGAVLWAVGGDTDTPVVSLDKVGIVFVALGALEVLWYGGKAVTGGGK